MSTTLNIALRNVLASAAGDEFASGFVDIYTGSQPAPDTAPTGTLLASCGINTYSPDSDGVVVATAITGTAAATGTAGYAQQRNAANTEWMYGSVSALGGGGDIQLISTSILMGATVTLTVSTITQPAS